MFTNLILSKEKVLYNGEGQVVTRPNPLKKDSCMDKITRRTSFGPWFSTIYLQVFEENVNTLKFDARTGNTVGSSYEEGIFKNEGSKDNRVLVN